MQSTTRSEWLEKFNEQVKPIFMNEVRRRIKAGVPAEVTEEQFSEAWDKLLGLVGAGSAHTDVWFSAMSCIDEGATMYAKREGPCPQQEPLTT